MVTNPKGSWEEGVVRSEYADDDRPGHAGSLPARRHLHHRVKRIKGGDDGLDNLELLHDNCHRQRHHQEDGTEADCVSREAFEEA
jgi:hypothetical protein